jgi:hypothetical protein
MAAVNKREIAIAGDTKSDPSRRAVRERAERQRKQHKATAQEGEHRDVRGSHHFYVFLALSPVFLSLPLSLSLSLSRFLPLSLARSLSLSLLFLLFSKNVCDAWAALCSAFAPLLVLQTRMNRGSAHQMDDAIAKMLDDSHVAG